MLSEFLTVRVRREDRERLNRLALISGRTPSQVVRRLLSLATVGGSDLRIGPTGRRTPTVTNN